VARVAICKVVVNTYEAFQAAVALRARSLCMEADDVRGPVISRSAPRFNLPPASDRQLDGRAGHATRSRTCLVCSRGSREM